MIAKNITVQSCSFSRARRGYVPDARALGRRNTCRFIDPPMAPGKVPGVPFAVESLPRYVSAFLWESRIRHVSPLFFDYARNYATLASAC